MESFANHVISVKHRRRYMKMYHQDKHEQIVRMGTKNSEQKGVAKIVAQEIEKAEGRSRIVRAHECTHGGEIDIHSMIRA